MGLKGLQSPGRAGFQGVLGASGALRPSRGGAGCAEWADFASGCRLGRCALEGARLEPDGSILGRALRRVPPRPAATPLSVGLEPSRARARFFVGPNPCGSFVADALAARTGHRDPADGAVGVRPSWSPRRVFDAVADTGSFAALALPVDVRCAIRKRRSGSRKTGRAKRKVVTERPRPANCFARAIPALERCSLGFEKNRSASSQLPPSTWR